MTNFHFSEVIPALEHGFKTNLTKLNSACYGTVRLETKSNAKNTINIKSLSIEILVLV